MIIQKIPHRAKLLIVNKEFIANYDSTSVRDGFDFSIALNSNKELFPVQTNTLYIWDSLSFAANIKEEFYLESIIEQPTIAFTKNLNGFRINAGLVALNKYSEGKNITTYFDSNNASDSILITCNGRLKMTYNLMGVNQVKIYVTCNVWEVNEKEYNINYALPTERSFSESLRR
jgi:hypothetical protein